MSTKTEDNRTELEALQAQVAALTTLPAVRQALAQEAAKRDQERAVAEHRAAYERSAEYRALQEQKERERAEQERIAEAARQRREARRAVAFIEDPEERNAKISAMSDADRSELLQHDLTLEELMEVAIDSPADWRTTWTAHPLYYSEQNRRLFSALTFELPARVRVTLSKDAPESVPESVPITRVQSEALSSNGRCRHLRGVVGDLRYQVREHEWSPIADAVAAEVLRPLVESGAVKIEPLTLEENLRYQFREFDGSELRAAVYPRRTRKMKRKKTTKTSE